MSAAASGNWPRITSAANPKLKTIKKLHTRRSREKLGLVLLEGHRLVVDALSAGFIPEYVVLHDAALDDAREGRRLQAQLNGVDCEVFLAPAELVNQLSDTATPQGVLAVFQTPALPLPPKPSLVLVCVMGTTAQLPMAVWRRRGEQPAVPEWHHPTEEDERKLAALDAEAYEKVDELEAEPEGRWAQMQQRMLILIGTIGVLSTELL